MVSRDVQGAWRGVEQVGGWRNRHDKSQCASCPLQASTLQAMAERSSDGCIETAETGDLPR